MIRKVIYLFSAKHLEEKDWEVNGFEIMRQNGFDIEIWSIVHMRYRCNIKEPKNLLTKMPVKYIKNEKEFSYNLSIIEKKGTIFLCYPSLGEDYCETSKFIRKAIRSRGYMYCDYCYPGIPNKGFIHRKIPTTFFEVVKYYVNFFSRTDLTLEEKRGEIEMFIFSNIYPSTYNFIPSDIKKLQLANKFEIVKKKSIMTHAFDYDLYLKNRSKRTTQFEEIGYSGKFIVFIDSYMHGHSDYKKNGCRSVLGKKVEKYFEEINSLFENLEKIYQCEVIIAAHPKAEYSDNILFTRRKMIYGKTDLLIKHSELVITTISTAVAYAILYKKKHIFYYNDEMQKSKLFKQDIGAFVHELEVKPLNISEKKYMKQVNEYINLPSKISNRKYVTQYIKSYKPYGKYYFQIVADALKRLK